MGRSLLLKLALVGALAGCDYDDDTTYYGDNAPDYGSCDANPAQGTIDTDALGLEVQPAEGVGLFVEYEAGGRFHLFTTCDTDLSGYACEFDVVVQPVGSGGILAVYPDNLERGDDSVTLFGEDTVELFATTDYDVDGFFIDVEPGAALRVDLLLDGYCANPYLYWVGDGAIHAGAPTNPFELVPSGP